MASNKSRVESQLPQRLNPDHAGPERREARFKIYVGTEELAKQHGVLKELEEMLSAHREHQVHFIDDQQTVEEGHNI
jgi:hypothetical protein